MNKESRSNYCHNYYQEHKEQVSAKHKKFYQENRDRILARQKNYAAKHKKERSEYKKRWGNSIRGKFVHYKSSAKQDNKIFLLSIEDFSYLVTSPCFYCGDLGKQGNGIDRVDSKLGYEIQNCVSCCTCCNKAKLTSTQREFAEQTIKRFEILMQSKDKSIQAKIKEMKK